ncbi:MAG TPA: hypothetical protein VH475_01015 [Tepidisphaeraceae bacterium]|jgi:hypothetical protein
MRTTESITNERRRQAQIEDDFNRLLIEDEQRRCHVPGSRPIPAVIREADAARLAEARLWAKTATKAQLFDAVRGTDRARLEVAMEALTPEDFAAASAGDEPPPAEAAEPATDDLTPAEVAEVRALATGDWLATPEQTRRGLGYRGKPDDFDRFLAQRLELAKGAKCGTHVNPRAKAISETVDTRKQTVGIL